MSIVANARVEDFFGEIVDGAIKAKGLNASDAARTYVIGLLADTAKPNSPVERTLDRPLTLLLDEALHTPELGDRFDKLRTLGDGVLYSSGFFADHFEARGVDTNYVIGIGRTAYDTAGSLISSSSTRLEDGPTDIFRELAHHFTDFVAILSEVANATLAKGAATSRGILKLYERWLKTRSDSLAEALSSHGFVAPRGGRVLS